MVSKDSGQTLDDDIVTVASNCRHLPEEDKLVAREFVLTAAMVGACKAQHLLWLAEDLEPERRWVLDRLRERCGLPTTGAVEDERQQRQWTPTPVEWGIPDNLRV